jgi:hypothetical protein
METASAANTPQASAITAANAPVVFISLRFGEATPEARALQQGLHARAISTFLCDIPEGQDLANAVVMALTHCKLAVILGTKTYGKKTASSFSTFEELRYIVNERKPFFLVKMCTEFEEAETRFRLPPDISYFPWQPANDAKREQLPAGLVDRVARRVQEVTEGWSGHSVAPPLVSAVSMRPAETQQAHGTAAAVNSAGVGHGLMQWLQSLQLDEFELALRKVGAVDAHDVRDGFAAGDITKEMLEAEGLKSLRITRLQREANKASEGVGAISHICCERKREKISRGGVSLPVALYLTPARLFLRPCRSKTSGAKKQLLCDCLHFGGKERPTWTCQVLRATWRIVLFVFRCCWFRSPCPAKSARLYHGRSVFS